VLACHLTVGARGALPLVRDDVDRFTLRGCAHESLDGLLLTDCIMDTHLHVYAEGDPEHAVRRLEKGVARYLRIFNLRHNRADVLRGKTGVHEIEDPYELARGIGYCHSNPCDCDPPIVPTPIEYRWSGARAYLGIALPGRYNVRRTLRLLGRFTYRALGPRPRLADLMPADLPCVTPELMLAAAAEVHRAPPWELATRDKPTELAPARALFIALGMLEGLKQKRLAHLIGRSQQEASHLYRNHAPSGLALRMARTLIRDATLRATLPATTRPPDPPQIGRDNQSDPRPYMTAPQIG
jgi:hypothetical protein